MSGRKKRKSLQFSRQELKSSGQDKKAAAQNKKIAGLEQKGEKINNKLDKARQKLPTKKVQSKHEYSQKSGRVKSKLSFNKESVPIGEAKWNRPKQKSLPQKGIGSVKTAAVNQFHAKVREAEGENVGVQGGHKAQLMGESAARGAKQATHSAYHFVRNTPYRRASELEVKSVKNDMKLTYKKALRDNPKLKSNPVSRLFQKRQIKKQYAAAFRTAKKTGQTVKNVKNVGGAVQKISAVATRLLRRNPVFMIKLGILALLIILLVSMLSMCMSMFSGGTSYVGGTTYAAEDMDINNAEVSYTQWETDLQVQIQNAQSTYPGYDEYRYNIGNIGHDPYELMAYLTAVYGDFTYAQVQPILQQIFGEQYQLTFTPSVEIRYREETTTTDNGDGTTTTTTTEVPYNWYVMTVTLTSVSMGDILTPIMDSDQQQQYELLMQSKGNRQYVDNPFDFDWIPYVSSGYGYRISPITGQEEFHQGIDIAVPQGTPIHAGFDGTVVFAGYDSSYGNYVLIQSADGTEARYAHCDTLAVTTGQTVKDGDVIGTVGMTGDATGPHLHLEVIKNGQTLDPSYFAVTGDDGTGNTPPGSPGGPVIPSDPGQPMNASEYQMMITYAEQYLGYPYVFGGSNPSTSFDCSGFVCWVLNQTGIASVGRTTAQGLYNMSTPVSQADAAPGDLVFFMGTRELNRKDTTAAQQKQETIKEAFRDWIFRDPERRQTLVHLYNERFNSVRPREYDGSHIEFTGMSPEITLKQHQKDAIARILYGGNTLLAHEVGTGKTFEMVAAAMEAKHLGLCQKSLIAVPNHLTEQMASEFLRLYPSANILVTTRKDFETANRKKFCAKIATGDYDAVVIGHSQFEKIPLSKERQERLLKEQIDEITDGIDELESNNGARFTIKQMEKTRKSLEARLERLTDGSRQDDVVTFEQLGVDRLFVDESHTYKNLFLVTKMQNVAGLSQSEAQKSSDMFMKCRYMDETQHGHGVIFATGTPVTNTMSELYTVQRYLQYDALEAKNLTHFDAWASTFGETQTSIELAPEGNGYRARTRFAKFNNLPELMSMFKEVADIKTADVLDLPRPKANFQTIVVEPTDIQKDMVDELSDRAKAVHDRKVEPNVDNMLKITSDGRKIGLDQRLMNPMLPDDPQSKVNVCMENIYKIWDQTADKKLTQLCFCDFSTPNADGRWNVYDDIKAKLIAKGVPAGEIAFIHDASTEIQKKELFAKVRQGKVRVLFGSTFKLGAGTNIQDRLIALHDLDCPWRPADLAQRAGRIVRQGNHNEEVSIFRYVTNGTFVLY